MTYVHMVNANSLKIPLADGSVHCIVTSPPYWGLRDYGVDGQLGNEATPEEFITNMVTVFRECWRVLRDDGVLWLNLGDSYARMQEGNVPQSKNLRVVPPTMHGRIKNAGLKPKDLVGIPWRVALALQADGWYLRSDIIWHKPNPMPESVTDRPTKAHEYVFLLTKSPRYFYDAEAVREPWTSGRDDMRTKGVRTGLAYLGGAFNNSEKDGEEGDGQRIHGETPSGRNLRSVWKIPSSPYGGAHFATYPPALVEPCIKAGTSAYGVCPECGAPWERVIDHQIVPTKKAPKTFVIDQRDMNADKQDQGSNRQKDGHKSGYISQNTTLGWQPTCDCGHQETRPAVVFDPFAGSGTTLMVARSLGRSGVGLDLSMNYIRECAIPRLQLDALDEWENGKKVEGADYSDLPMFGLTNEQEVV